jgi:hypothetical protein
MNRLTRIRDKKGLDKIFPNREKARCKPSALTSKSATLGWVPPNLLRQILLSLIQIELLQEAIDIFLHAPRLIIAARM